MADLLGGATVHHALDIGSAGKKVLKRRELCGKQNVGDDGLPFAITMAYHQ